MNPSERVDALWKTSIDNQVKLSECPRHLFEMKDYTAPVSVSVIHCMRCNGQMSLAKALVYIEGFLAAGGRLAHVAANVKVPMGSHKRVCPCCDGKNRKPYPGAWSGVDCPLCKATGRVDLECATAYLIVKG